MPALATELDGAERLTGIYGPDDQESYPEARAVPAACPSGGSPTAIHGQSRSNQQRP